MFFTDSSQLYPDTQFSVEAILCNTGILSPGKYSCIVSVQSSEGVVWRENIDFFYPEDKPFAASVMKILLPGFPPGEYVFSVYVEGIQQPTCTELKLRVHETNLPALSVKIYPVGNLKNAEKFLLDHNVTLTNNAEDSDIICIGTTERKNTEKIKTEILKYTDAGKKVLILDEQFWTVRNTSPEKFMGSIEYNGVVNEGEFNIFGSCIYVRNWLYHMNGYIADSNIFNGLAKSGLLDMDLFRAVYPDHYFAQTGSPQKTYCASFGSGLFIKESCLSALNMGEFKLRKGSVIVNTFKIIDNVGKSPVADRLFYNLIYFNSNSLTSKS